MKRGPRGLRIFSQFVDTHGCWVTVQESSSTKPRCWVFCEDDHTPHLSPSMARRVAKALLKFADTTKRTK